MVVAGGGVGAAAAFTGGGSATAPQVSASATATPAIPTSTATSIPSTGAGTGAGSGSGTGAASPAASATETSTAPGGDQPARHRRASVALALSVPGKVSWVQVSRPGGRVVFQGMLRHGHRLTYRRGPLDVIVGDAGAVRVQRGRHVVSPFGRPGEVRHFTAR